MPITRYTASADTTITNAYFPNSSTRALYANMGAADSLELFAISSSLGESEKSRILLNFPVTQISASRASGSIPASGSVNFFLKVYNVQHPETLPRNYDIILKPISGSESWDEGYGLDIETHSDSGRSGSVGFGTNWVYRNSGSAWSTQGGDYLSSYNKVFHFDTGLENIDVDVTDLIEAQISSIIPSTGIGIMISGSYEDGTSGASYYTKRFSARSSEYFYNRPSIEVRWESTIKDDRGYFYYTSNNLSNSDNLQNIYFYNRVNGTLKNLPSGVVPKVKIYDEDGNFLTGAIDSINVSTGVYKASFTITGATEQQLTDVWYSGSTEYYTGSIQAYNRIFEDTATKEEFIFSLTNLKNAYKTFEKPTIRVFGRQKDWSPNIYKIATKDINNLTFKNLYYKIIRIVDGLAIIDYGVDPIKYTLCSYDKNGNYFDLDMNLFETGYAYGIKLMLVTDDTKTEYNQVFRFKVE